MTSGGNRYPAKAELGAGRGRGRRCDLMEGVSPKQCLDHQCNSARRMPGAFTLYSADGERVRFPDPSGGEADAAGDFDNLLWRSRGELRVLAKTDPDAHVDFTSEEAAAMEMEIEYLLKRAAERPQQLEPRHGAAQRGLMRLREMARWCAAHEGSRIAWRGD